MTGLQSASIKRSSTETSVNKMCYAFNHLGAQEGGSDRETCHVKQLGPLASPPVTNSLKRSADCQPEERQAKAPKIAEDAEGDDVFEDVVKGLKAQLTKAKARIEKLDEEKRQLDERVEELVDELVGFRANEERQKQKGKGRSQDSKAHDKQISEKAREIFKAEQAKKDARTKAEDAKKYDRLKTVYQRKIDDNRQDYRNKIDARDEKHADELEAKDKACKKRVDEYKEKNSKLEQETKEAKAGFAESKKKSKEECETLKKELREEQQRQINAWKPEHSKAVKEKDNEIKAKNDEIKKLQVLKTTFKSTAEKLEKKLNEVTEERDSLQADVNKKDSELEDRKNYIDDQHQNLDTSTKANQDLIECYEAKLARQDKTLQDLRNMIEKYKKELFQAHRQQFQWRDVLNKATARIEELEKERCAILDELDILKGGSGPGLE